MAHESQGSIRKQRARCKGHKSVEVMSRRGQVWSWARVREPAEVVNCPRGRVSRKSLPCLDLKEQGEAQNY